MQSGWLVPCQAIINRDLMPETGSAVHLLLQTAMHHPFTLPNDLLPYN
jgi:hypothetical protein